MPKPKPGPVINCRDCLQDRSYVARGRRCIDCYNARQRDRSRERYRTEPEFRDARKASVVGRKYPRNVERSNARQRQRYATDQAYRIKLIAASSRVTLREAEERHRDRPPMPGEVVYFIQNIETGRIKIGYVSSKVDQRLSDLQVGNDCELRLLAVASGTRIDELRAHRRFESAWVRGEWFRPVPELLDYISGLTVAKAA